MTSDDVARMLNAASGGYGVPPLRAIQQHLAAKLPGDRDAEVLSRTIQTKIDRLMRSN